MSDDIETLCRLADGLGTEERKEALSALERVNATLHNFKDSFEREYAIVHKIWEQLGLPSYEELNGRSIHDLIDEIKTDRDALRKALDDRHAADKKAWSAIMRATGKERGLPDNKEVVAFYVAEVERLENERDIASERKRLLDESIALTKQLLADRDSLRAKLDEAIAQLRSKDPNFTPIFDSYSASCERWHDEAYAARAKLDRAKEALKPFAEAEKTMMRSLGKTADDHLYGVYAGDLRRAAAVHSELSDDAAPNEFKNCTVSSVIPGGYVISAGTPAQQTLQDGVKRADQEWERRGVEINPRLAAQQTQISDEAEVTKPEGLE